MMHQDRISPDIKANLLPAKYQDQSNLGKTLNLEPNGSPLKAEHFLSKGYKAYKAHVDSRNQSSTYRAMNQGNKRDNFKDARTPGELIHSKTVEQLPVKQGKLGVNAQNPPSVLDSMKLAPSKFNF